MKARLLVVEDDRDLARGLEFNLAAEGYAVQLAADGRAARLLLREGSVDLILLDLTLPDGDGLELLRELRAGGATTPVVCLTARSQETDVVTGLKLGADDYVTKPFGLAQLMARVEAVLRRTRAHGAHGGAQMVELGGVVVDLDARTVQKSRPSAVSAGSPVPEIGEEELTPIETDLLRYFLARRGKALDRAQILKDLWGVEGRHSTRTLDNHVARLRKKIELDPANPRFLVTAHGVGYRFEA